MNKIRNDFNPNLKQFFINLQNYLDTELYFYGSVNRSDYIHNKSDIDVAIFTNNIEGTLLKLQNFLNEKRSSFKKFVYRLRLTNKVAYGYKVKYDDPQKLFTAEIAIYSENLKNEVLIEQYSKCDIPFYISFLLYLLKFLFYRLNILPFKLFIKCKRFCLNYLVVGEDTEYVLLH